MLENWTMPYLILFYITIIVLEVDSCKISKDVLFPQSIYLLSHLCGGCQNTPIIQANSATQTSKDITTSIMTVCLFLISVTLGVCSVNYICCWKRVFGSCVDNATLFVRIKNHRNDKQIGMIIFSAVCIIFIPSIHEMHKCKLNTLLSRSE